MKKLLLLFVLAVVLTSCKKESNQINVVLDEEFVWRLHRLKIDSEDTLVYTSKLPLGYGDTLKFRNLPNGEYKVSYLDMLGKTRVETVKLRGSDTIWVKPKPNDINVNAFYNETPISKIKNGEEYQIRKRGGCVATMETAYILSKEEGRLYLTPFRGKKTEMSKSDINKVRQFEAELLAIRGVDISWGTGSSTYTIIKDNDTLRIQDKTGMWDSWINLSGEKLFHW